jgi:hypothetical protein
VTRLRRVPFALLAMEIEYVTFWGAPADGSPDMERVGTMIVDAFRQHGFTVDWNGSGAERPIVDLRDVGAAAIDAKG